MERLLSGKVAVITGGGRGIGEATARLLASEGASVVIADVDEGPALAVKAAIEGAGGKAAVATGDVRSGEDCGRICAAAAQAFGKIDILVNNAGTTRDKVAHQMTDEIWNLVIDICLKGPFNMIRAASPYLRDPAKAELEKSGRVSYQRKVVNVSSTAALRGNPGQINYTAAKAGVVGMTKTMAREWGRFGVNVNCVTPGFVDTRLTKPRESASSPLGLAPDAADNIRKVIALGRIGVPGDIANAILFLSSPLADWITGQTIVVDGGLT